MATSGVKILIYIDRNRIDFYPQGASVATSLQVAPEVVSDIEVRNPDQMVQVVVAFLTTQKIENARAVCILSPNVVFEKQFPSNSTSDMDAQIEEYVSKIPFEHVLSKAISTNEGYKVYATNEDLIDTLRQALSQKEVHIDAVVPLAQVEPQVALSHSFNVSTAQALLQKFGNLRTQGFLLEEQNTVVPGESQTREVKKKDYSKKRLYVFSAIFIGLILVLIVMVLRM